MMQRLFWILVILNFLILPVEFFILPGQVAVHFDLAGQPNGWMPNFVNVLLVGILSSLMVLIFLFCNYMMKVCPPEFINVPNHDYWTRKENLDRLRRISFHCFWEWGAIALAIILFVEIETICANLVVPPKMNPYAIIIPFVLTALLLGSLFRMFWVLLRIPKDKKNLNEDSGNKIQPNE